MRHLVFLGLLVSIAAFLSARKVYSLTFLSIMTLYFLSSSYYLNTHWKSEESFWLQSVKYGGVALAHTNYGFSIVMENPRLAEHHYLEAIRQHPFHIYANVNLGMLYIEQKREEEGIQILYKVADLNPDWAFAHYWLSIGLDRTGQKGRSGRGLQARDAYGCERVDPVGDTREDGADREEV